MSRDGPFVGDICQLRQAFTLPSPAAVRCFFPPLRTVVMTLTPSTGIGMHSILSAPICGISGGSCGVCHASLLSCPLPCSRGMPVEIHWRMGTTIILPGSTDDSPFLCGDQVGTLNFCPQLSLMREKPLPNFGRSKEDS